MSAAPDPLPHCCDDMRRNLEFTCTQHESPFECPDSLVYYSDKFDEYGLIVHGSPSYVAIAYCPWCGVKLPDSMRDKWFDEVAALGFDPAEPERLPAKYHSAAWRKPRQS